MNSRIYLQPDALPTQDMIRTANRLFRHFAKEVTFLQQVDKETADITMNRLRWALIMNDNFDKALVKSGNLILDMAYNTSDDFKKVFDDNDEIANLIVINNDDNESVIEFAKEDQTKAKRK